MAVPTELAKEIAYQRRDLEEQLERCMRTIVQARARLTEGHRVYAYTLHTLEEAVAACTRLATLESVARSCADE